MEQLDINQHNDDTICAVSTPAGVGGIAVVRVSGRDAVKCVMKSWRGADLNAVQTHTLHLGRIVDTDGETLDEVVAAVFRGPRSFTGEDVIELSCHGSLWVQQQLVALLIGNGCRAAEGGEFTRRAFMNGRLDLSQAEAVADVIASGSKAAHRIAVSQMRGGFSRMLSTLRERLLEFVSLMELELDFSEEDVEFADRTRLIAIAEEINTAVTRLADSFAVGNATKNGLPVAIAQRRKINTPQPVAARRQGARERHPRHNARRDRGHHNARRTDIPVYRHSRHTPDHRHYRDKGY